jgi:hypothetical protein
MRWEGLVARIEENRIKYRVLVGKPEGIRPLFRPSSKWADNIKLRLKGIVKSECGMDKFVSEQ